MSTTIYLYLKTHNRTGLKYLGKTIQDPFKYKGSGKRWINHLKKHGNDVTTEILFETTDKKKFSEVAIEYSKKWNIVDSDEFANFVLEEGQGGDTVSKKMWISKDGKSKYHNVDEPIPDGWTKGRANCIFNDGEKQKEFASRVDLEKRGESIKKAWDEGKMDHRDNSNIGKNQNVEAIRKALQDSWKKRKLKNVKTRYYNS